MGNCIKKESSTQWGGEDWDFSAPGNAVTDEERQVLEEKKGNFSSSTVTEVKIKITKKQLEDLMGKVDVQGQTVQQVLTQLMNLSDGYHETHPGSWRPALQSIPEADLY